MSGRGARASPAWPAIFLISFAALLPRIRAPLPRAAA
jgi:hypothetical protein